ncbi:hypothetical protein QWY75_04345 [Pontixanthobacter aestiaquae]|uniref:Uncharacterized protein n=1 Tax=Pontixanthobacter aestiaquae TaxID=1509367 RepID=A0A844Z8B8_9SPHN|nr:hypothetical protein [Pontixanthobacter aestiaquae]MDN3645438.1 hypothetical protein [Pontixanthobacter aestiaquae]MXO83562.1 hypothetical protein [Pontixanthobacter aestiaquae]
MRDKEDYPDPRTEDIMAGDRRISRPDSSLPDWYISDASYRPIPIAWFAGALILQVIAMPAIYFILLGFNGLFTIAVAGLISVVIGFLTWERGMSEAGLGWRIATVTMLVTVFALVLLATLPRI